jgi:SAM-dependent methyltransferase
MAPVMDLVTAETTSTSKEPLRFDEIVERIRELVADLSAGGRPIRVLEAGCGSGRKSWVFRFPPNAYVVGIDNSQEVLEKNEAVSEKILADIQSDPLRPRDYDLIICFDVLEHLAQPEKALANFAGAIQENGMIVLASPLVNSMKGIITKFTPHWFHVFAYRYLLGDKNAGRPGFGPFPTVLRWSISPASLLRFAQDRGLATEYLQLYRGRMWDRALKRNRALGIGCYLVGRLIELLSFGRITAATTDFVMVLRKPSP